MTVVFRRATQLVGVAPTGLLRKTGSDLADLGILANGSLIVRDGQIAWVGPDTELPPLEDDAVSIDVSGQVVSPGLIDSHTHLIYAGSRADELELRLQGLSYQEISSRGGGIMSTVNAVRQCSLEQLKDLARPRLRRMLAHGVTTVEIKSGYGLTLADEMKCLNASAELAAEGPLEVVSTFLGAHCVPADYRHDRAGYLRLLVEKMLPEVAASGLAEFCDVFTETGVFDLVESRYVLDRARQLGLGCKVHADELTPLNGAVLAASVGAISADHLLCVTEAGIAALAGSKTVATLLPGTALYLGLPFAPARRMIDQGLTVALASDCNPGTCPTENLPLIGSLACLQMGMLPAEVMNALTINAAAAVGRSDRLGSLSVGKQADLAVFGVTDYREIFSQFGVNHVRLVVKRGEVVYSTDADPGANGSAGACR